jgi:hypothetical protein
MTLSVMPPRMGACTYVHFYLCNRRETAPFDSHCRNVLERPINRNKYFLEQQLESVNCIGLGVQVGQTFVHPSSDHVFHPDYLLFTEANPYNTAQVAAITNYSRRGFRTLSNGAGMNRAARGKKNRCSFPSPLSSLHRPKLKFTK